MLKKYLSRARARLVGPEVMAMEARAFRHRGAASAALVKARLARNLAAADRREIERAGYVLVPNEAAALLSHVVARGGISGGDLATILVELGLARENTYDPTKGTCIGDPAPGDRVVTFTPELMRVLQAGAPHLKDIRRRLH